MELPRGSTSTSTGTDNDNDSNNTTSIVLSPRYDSWAVVVNPKRTRKYGRRIDVSFHKDTYRSTMARAYVEQTVRTYVEKIIKLQQLDLVVKIRCRLFPSEARSVVDYS